MSQVVFFFFFRGVGVRGRAFLESFFGGKDGIDELKVHGLDDRDVCFILILILICGKTYCGNLFLPDLIAKQK